MERATPMADLWQRCLDALAMALVAGISFLVLIYVGYGEAQRSYEQFYIDKLAAQNRMIQSGIESYLRRDLPLRQYVGFRARAERLLASDPSIQALVVYDSTGNAIFTSGTKSIGYLAAGTTARLHKDGGAEIRRDSEYLQVILPLTTRYERVGSLVITMERAEVDHEVEGRFLALLPIGAVIAILFAGFVGAARDWLGRQKLPWLQIVYAVMFMAMAVFVIGTLVKLYTRGAQVEAQALADSLGQRMTEIVGLQLDLNQLNGLDRAFGDYRRLNPDISAVALTVDGRIVIHTDPYMVGKPWGVDPSAYEYVVDITPAGSAQEISVAVVLPEEIVYHRIMRSAKNFAALFVASAFLASIFLQLVGTVRSQQGGSIAAHSDHSLRLIKPVFYVAMCVEHLIYAFLPKFLHDRLAEGGAGVDLTALVFTTYYVCFALTLVPAGFIAQRTGSRMLMSLGLVLTSAGLLTLMIPGGLPVLVAGRILAGTGQAMLFIGVQSYILAHAPPEKKTQGAAIIVFGFQGGMISGMAIGSLLVTYIGPNGVFAIGATVAAALAIYAFMLIPAVEPRLGQRMEFKACLVDLRSDLGSALKSPNLLETLGLIGIPAKAVLTGVIVFALPLLMAEKGYRQEDIGQMLMIYAGGVVMASGPISRWVDQTGSTVMVLVAGAVTSALGLGLISLIDSASFGEGSYAVALQTALLVVGILIVGLAHGMINAPVVTHVAELDVAGKIGSGAATASYRFVERAGHVAGPIVVGWTVNLTGHAASALSVIAVVVGALGLLFLWRASAHLRRRPTKISSRFLGLYIDPPDMLMVLAIEGDAAIAARDPMTGPRTASITGEMPTGPVTERRRARRVQEFVAAAYAMLPSGGRLQIVGTGQAAGAGAAPLGNRTIDLRMLSSTGEWLTALGTTLAEVKARDPEEGKAVVRQLARAMVEQGQAPKRPGRSGFAWVRGSGEPQPTAPDPAPAATPVAIEANRARREHAVSLGDTSH